MNRPGFTAQASLYRTSNHYFTSAPAGCDATPTQSVMAQSGERFANCDSCEKTCTWTNYKCQATASAAYAIVAGACVGFVFPPAVAACEAVAAGVYAGAIGACYAWWGECMTECWLPGNECCPVFCELGHCCSEGETCIPRGCCPNDRIVCNGQCCDVGETCCGGTCCPGHYYCLDGFCSEFPSPLLPPGNSQPPTPPPSRVRCRKGWKACGPICCPSDLQCCSVGGGQVACMTNCLH